MPGNLVLSPDGKFAFVNTSGYHGHSVNVVDLASKKVVQSVDVGRIWVGMAFDPRKSELYVSGGSSQPYKPKPHDAGPNATDFPAEDAGPVLRFTFTDGRLQPQPPIKISGLDEKERFVSGILSLADGSLVVLNIQNDTVYKLNGDTVVASRKVGYRPYGVVASPDGKTLAVTNWGDGSVTLLRSDDLIQIAEVRVGTQPSALAYAPDGRLFVSNGGSNTVSVVDGQRVVETINVGLNANDLIGSNPIALAIDPTSHRLYVANAGNNAVAVVDISNRRNSKGLGFLPTGRYPSAVAVDLQRKQILVGTAQGLEPRPSASAKQLQHEPVEGNPKSRYPYTYVADLMEGDLAFIPSPGSSQLADFTKQVIANRPKGSSILDNPDAKRILAAMRKIKHVLYVIRENRTYDQVLGDIPQGNGEPKLVMFGQQITPNSHRLVQDTVLFDNLFTDGEVSQIGHQWTDAAYATDYCEKMWTQSYSNRGEIDSDTRLTSSPAGYIWGNAKRHGKAIRIYGEYVEWQEDHDAAHGEVKENPEKFDCSAEFEKIFARGGRDTEKVDLFLKEMHAAEQTGKWPNFMVMALPEDHTRGLSANAYTPQACVANNDQALGRLIEGISHSKFWPETAVFIIQDDAQDGPDHVDAHRTVGLVVSPYGQRKFVDHTHYTTSSMLRTMELILGLPPMTQYDAAATPMIAAFTDKPDFSAFDCLPAQYDVNLRNPSKGALVARSAKLDFSDIDRADPTEFNAILWEAIKPGQPMPPPVHSAIWHH